jgi:hypothetical protein
LNQGRRPSKNGRVKILLCAQLAKVAGRSRFDWEPSGTPTVQAALRTIFWQSRDLERYILDGTDALDRRTAVFVDSATRRDRLSLLDELPATCTLHVMRSLGPPVGMCWSSDWRQHRMGAIAGATHGRQTLADHP